MGLVLLWTWCFSQIPADHWNFTTCSWSSSEFPWLYRVVFDIHSIFLCQYHTGVYLNRNWRGTGVQIYFDGLVHPCEKVTAMFFQNQIWSRFLDISGLCLVCIKRSIQEVKKCQISKHGYHQGPSDETLKKHDVNFAMSSSVTALWRRCVSLTIKCTVLSKLLLISQTSEARELFDDLRRWFA